MACFPSVCQLNDAFQKQLSEIGRGKIFFALVFRKYIIASSLGSSWFIFVFLLVVGWLFFVVLCFGLVFFRSDRGVVVVSRISLIFSELEGEKKKVC